MHFDIIIPENKAQVSKVYFLEFNNGFEFKVHNLRNI